MVSASVGRKTRCSVCKSCVVRGAASETDFVLRKGPDANPALYATLAPALFTGAALIGGIIFVGPYGDPYGYPYGYPYDGPFDDGYGLDDGLLGPPAAALPPAPPRLPYILGNRYDALPGGGCLTMIAGGAAYYDCGGEWYRQVGPAQYMAVTQP